MYKIFLVNQEETHLPYFLKNKNSGDFPVHKELLDKVVGNLVLQKVDLKMEHDMPLLATLKQKLGRIFSQLAENLSKN